MGARGATAFGSGYGLGAGVAAARTERSAAGNSRPRMLRDAMLAD